jgi:hypothetical protein
MHLTIPPREQELRGESVVKEDLTTAAGGNRYIEQELAGDPYAQKVFGELLKLAIAEAEAMFDHPMKQYALCREFEERIAERTVPEMHRYAPLVPAKLRRLVRHAQRMEQLVRDAVAENSLNPQNMSRPSAKRCCLCFSTIWAWTRPRRRLSG